MTIPSIPRRDLYLAQTALFVAILLQVIAWMINADLNYGPHTVIIATEILLAISLVLSASAVRKRRHPLWRSVSIALLGLISVENIVSFVSVTHLLIAGSGHVSGRSLLAAALAIFITNIIIFSLWYWEIDSPGFTGNKWSRHDKDFQFTQQDLHADFPDWQPGYVDYLYLSLTNAINFAPADVRPITQQAKALMGLQSLVSVFTLALILARSISILR